MYKELISQIKKQILYFIAIRFYLKRRVEIQSFSEFLSNSQDCLLIMPEDPRDFDYALEFADKIISREKRLTLILKDNQVSYLKARRHFPYIAIDNNSFNKIKLPSKQMIDLLKARRFDIVVDLNIPENIFYSVLVSIANAKYKIGFNKKSSEDFYNLIIRNNEINSAISYRNLLNSLQMF